MPTSATLAVYLPAVLLIAITPGPSILFILARSLSGGRRDGALTTAGDAAGSSLHVVGAALGISALIVASEVAFTALRVVGGLYLIGLGVVLLLRRDQGAAFSLSQRRRGGHPFVQGAVTGVLNPKLTLFYYAFLPQFVDPNRPTVPQFLVLGAISLTANVISEIGVVLVAGPLGERLSASARWRATQRRVSGVSMIGLGVWSLLARPAR